MRRLGDKWFVVSELWWGRVVEAGDGTTASDSDDDADAADEQQRAVASSSRIQNDRLVDRSRSCRCCSSSLLKPGLVEGVDYRLVSERVWRALALEFGYDWEICRSVVSLRSVYGGPTELIVDVYPAKVQGHVGAGPPEYPPPGVDFDGEAEAPPRGDLDEPWRQELQPGHLLDALDTGDTWYEARVVEASTSQVKVHYRGWSTRWDEWIDRQSRRLMPLHTRVREWRKFKVDDSVQVGVPVPGKKRLEWRDARVLATADTLLVQLRIDNGQIEWVDAQEERLCPPGTHRVRTTAASSVPNGRKRARVNGDAHQGDRGGECDDNALLFGSE